MKRWLALGVVVVGGSAGCALIYGYEPFGPGSGGGGGAGSQLCSLYDVSPGECAGAFRDCNGDESDGCETQVDVDAANCGYCGHVCEAGCDVGACAVETVGPMQAIPLRTYGVHRGAVYLTIDDVGDGIRVIDVDDGSEAVVPIFGADTQIAFDGDFVYATGFAPSFCTGSSFGWCAAVLPVGSTTPSVLTGDILEFPGGLATTEGAVFIAESGSGDPIVRIAKAGGALTEVAAGFGGSRDIAGTPSWVYWGTATGLMRASDDGATVETVSDDDVTAVATRGDSAYWAADGAIRRLVDGTPETLLSGLGVISWLGLTDEYLYWVDGDALYRYVRCETGAPEAIAGPGLAAISDSHIYFTTDSGRQPARQQH